MPVFELNGERLDDDTERIKVIALNRAAYVHQLCQDLRRLGDTLADTLRQGHRPEQVGYDHFMSTFAAVIPARLTIAEPTERAPSTP
ncbi:hypothetical protein [Azospirillum thermophilum]|nr:hypothetical protein [Azospirillum thermophilum]